MFSLGSCCYYIGFERCGIQPRAFKLKDGTYRDEIIMVKML